MNKRVLDDDTPHSCKVHYRTVESSPHYAGGEFLEIYICLDCPACPDDGGPFGILEFAEDEEIVAKCPECGYSARVSVYEEGA